MVDHAIGSAATRSDDELLEISIDTPICEMSLENMSLCRNGCPKVDHLKADLTLAFGWRHFAENEIEDLVTPAMHPCREREKPSVQAQTGWAVIFSDGFESGDASAWSSTVQ